MDLSIPNRNCFQFGRLNGNTPKKRYRGGMHKCIPYAKTIVLRFVEPWWFMNLSERINAFPTNTYLKIPNFLLMKVDMRSFIPCLCFLEGFFGVFHNFDDLVAPFIQPNLKSLRFGMHKCIPYESSIVFPINEHAKFQFTLLFFPPRSTGGDSPLRPGRKCWDNDDSTSP